MRALVTGGGGFLGGAIVERLLARGDQVRSIARGDYPALRARGVEVVRGDLADADAVDAAVEGCDIVFHVAAKAGIWGKADDYRRCNLTATEKVLAACRKHGVSRLVYTSTPSVVFDGRGHDGIDESAPYPDRFYTHYQATKAAAERLVLAANGEGGLLTVALRPHLIWGPGDPHLVPRVIERGRAGQLRVVGGSLSKVDSVYIDNAADAHIAAADRLETGAACCGKAYFISNGEPLPMADLLDRILAAGGVAPISRNVPFGVAYAAGAVFEAVYGLLRIEREPKMTRFLALQLATPHWFDISAARRDLGWEPRVSIDEGLVRLGAWLRGESSGVPEAAGSAAP